MPPKAPSGGDRPVANKHAIVSTVEYQRFIEHRWKLLWISAVTWWSVLSLVALLVWCGIAVHGDGVATHAHDEHLPSPGHVFLWNVTWYLVVPLACWSAATLLALASFKSKKWFDNVMRTDTPSLDFRDSRTAEDGGERLARDAWLVFAWPANVVLLGIFGKASVAERYRLGRTLRSRERELDDEEFGSQLRELLKRRTELEQMVDSEEKRRALALCNDAILYCQAVPLQKRKDEQRVRAANILQEVESLLVPAQVSLEAHKALMAEYHEPEMRRLLAELNKGES